MTPSEHAIVADMVERTVAKQKEHPTDALFVCSIRSKGLDAAAAALPP
jgi:hypothetical protein